MAKLSRRQFLARSSLTVAGGVAAAAAGPQVAHAFAETSGAEAPPAKALEPRSADQPVVAYVRGGTGDEVTIMAGHGKVVRKDPELVRRLLDAAD